MSEIESDVGNDTDPGSDGPDEDIRGRLRRFSARQQDFERHLAEQLDVDSGGLGAMNHLGAVGLATPTEIARRLDISTAATTLLLNRLESAGHISRGPHPTDRRKVVITPTPGTVAAAQHLIQPVIDGVERIAGAMTDDQRAVVAGFLDDMVDLYDRALRDRRD